MDHKTGVENPTECQARRVVVNSSKANWQLLMSGFPQQSIQCPILFSIFITELDDRNECRLARDTKPGTERETLEGRATIQTDFKRLEDCINKNHVSFDEGKCKVLHLGWNNPSSSTVWGLAS